MNPLVNKERKKTYPVKVGNLLVGGGFPVSVQTMWKKPLKGITDDIAVGQHHPFGPTGGA